MRPSPLLALPAELRESIWKLALGGQIFAIHCRPSYKRGRVATRVLNGQKNYASLLRVCYQIYIETKLVPFQQNAFRIRSEDALSLWFGRLQPWAQQAIAEVHLVTWRAVHMVEGLMVFPRPLSKTLDLRKLPGLQRVCIEVRSKVGDLQSGDSLAIAEERLKQRIKKQHEHVQLVFERLPWMRLM
jgi:hypothetical protein